MTPLAPHERLPEILVVPREKTPTGAASQPQDHLLRPKGKELQKIKSGREGNPLICCTPRWGWGKEVGEQDNYDYLQSFWASLG